ncbi:MAG: M28 family peptidase [Bacteroidetes bacterium]|nr:M28 family peptidase [Bacteroidota bacterium]
MLKHRLFIYTCFMFAFCFVIIPENPAQTDKQQKYYRGTPINPIVEAMINSVSTDSILINLQTLVSFHTRHTNSDTTSANFGIGAARNFILSKFQQFSSQTSGGVQPSFFVFPATVCGIFNSAHKNVLATIPGSQTPDRIFIASGHMDGRTHSNCDNNSFAPSANDDGSGTVVSIEMARVISQFADEIESTLILMTVTGEDQGLFGSTAYADWAFENNLRIDGMITNDVVGNITGCVNPACPNGEFITDSTSVRHFSGGPSTSSSRQLTRYMKLKAEQYITEVPWNVTLIPAIDRPGRGGDHQAFFDNGYTAARFTEPHEFGDGTGDNGRQHNEFDLVEFVNIPYVARIVKNNIAGLAILAMAPETPTAPLNALNEGNGTNVILSWTKTNTETDFAGYRIAWRFADSLFYEEIFLAGNVTEFTLTGLTPDEPIYISYSAIDTSSNESIFSSEILITPSDIPAVPQGFEATSTETGIQFTWFSNTELDLDGYLLTRTGPGAKFVEFDIGTTPSTFIDNTALPHVLYYYTIQARDIDNNFSNHSEAQRGQLATHDSGILVLDATKDGSGNFPLFPSDKQVDDYYTQLLTHFNVGAEWDIADSLDQNLAISDADMGIYSTVVVHSDTRTATHKLTEDTLSLRKYLQNGGQIFMSGWHLIKNISGDFVLTKNFMAGDFVYDYMFIDTVDNAITNDFKGADPLFSSYPSITVDSVKLPNFGGDLISMEVFRSLINDGDTEALYTYRSSEDPPSVFHGQPVALRHITNDLSIVIFDFPLYFMRQDEAMETIEQALTDMGEVTGINDEEENLTVIPREFDLNQNYPNPFNPTTVIEFALPVKSKVELSVYNLLGEKIVTLVNEEKDAGNHQVLFNAINLSSGIYFYKLQAGDPSASSGQSFVQTKKMILLK